MWRRLFSAIAVMGVLVPLSVAAADSPNNPGTITISPPIKQIIIASGLLQADSVVTLANTTDSEVSVSIKTVDFTPRNNGLIVFGNYELAGTQAGLAQWMSLPGGPSLTIKAGQKAAVHVLIDNRADLAPGGHYGAVIFSTTQLNPTGANRVALNQQLTSLFFVKKVGGDISKLELVSLKHDGGSSVPTTATMTFKSTGNVYVIPRGYVQVTDAHGTLLAKGLLNPTSSLIPQGTTRSLDVILAPVEGAKAQGRLKLTAYYRYDGKNSLATTTVYLNNTPFSWVKTIFVPVVALGIVVSIYVLRRRRKNSVQKRRFHTPTRV